MGYFAWDKSTNVITNAFVIPRGVGVIADGGVIAQGDDGLKMRIAARNDVEDRGILQVLFICGRARSMRRFKSISLAITLQRSLQVADSCLRWYFAHSSCKHYLSS